MKPPLRSVSPARSLVYSLTLASAFVFGTAVNSAASTVTINFDSLAPDSSGIDPTVYLAGYGVTLSGVSPSATSDPLVYSDQAFYGTGAVGASSGHNFLLQQAAVNGGAFTLNFATGLTNVEFTRIRNITPNLVGTWTATAYSGALALGSVSEAFGLGPFTSAVYSFSGSNITSLSISGNGFGAAGIASAMIDDLKLTSVDSVPDTGNTLALVGISLASLAALRRRFIG